MKTLTSVLVSLCIALGCACVTRAATTTMLTPLSTFGPGGDGSIQPPGSYPPYPPVTVGSSSAGYQRGYAYDPTTANTVLVDPNVGSAGTNANFQGGVYVIDGNTGIVISTLDTNGIYGGTYPASALGVADDGVVYMCNAVNSSGTMPFVIYRWSSVWQSNVAPSIAYSNTIAPSQRYGATMDVRGAGAGTQIIIGSKAQSTSGTNVTVFTTTDGTNFTAISLATAVTTADFADGIAFGSGNTFWAKSVSGGPLRLMSFNLATSNATVLATFDTNSLPGTAGLGPIALDLNNKLMAAIELVSPSVGPQRVWLFDITATLADSTKTPALLDVESFSPRNTAASAPNGFLDFGGGNLYVHVINNGLLTFTNAQVTTPSPTFLIQPVASQRLVATRPASFQALAYPAVTYQWTKNGTNVLNATNATYTIASTAVGDTGTYAVAVSNNSGTVQISSGSVLTVINPADLYHLNTLWSVGASSGASYFNGTGGANTPNQRTMAYNALSNELYIVSKASGFTIYALSATNVSATPPAVLKTLNTTGISGGSIALVAIAVADDGAIYACNMDTSASSGTANWKLYRWANSDPATAPQLVYQGEPTGLSATFRWGDVMSARFSGPNTQILIDNYNSSARYVALFSPTDSSMTSFTNTWFYPGQVVGTTIGRSLEFGTGETIWQKRYNSALVQSGYDTNQPQSAMTTLGTYSGFPSTDAGVSLSLDRNLCAGINFGSSPAHTLDVYDVSDLTAPLTIAQYAFPVAKIANNNYIGQTIIAGNYLFTLDGNNGVMAFQIIAGPPTAPGFVQQPQNLRLIQGGSGALSVVADQLVTLYQWQRSGTNLSGATTSSYPISNAQLANADSYLCIVSNIYGMGTSTVATVAVTLTNDAYGLLSAWNAAPGTQPYITTAGGANSPYERSIAYNALSNQVIVVQCPVSSAAYTVYVLDGATGNLLYTLNTNGVVHEGSSEVSGSNPSDLDAVAVADDGAVYICNLTPNASGGSGFDPTKMFRLYRWADSGSNTAPVCVFVGDPAGQTANYRWGDAMAVRGSGTNTQVLLDSNDGSLGAMLVPTDSTLLSFTNLWWSILPVNGIGRSLQFGTNNSTYGKRYGTPLRLSGFDTNAHTSTIAASYANFASTQAGLTLDPALNLAAGVDFNGATNAPDSVVFLEVSDLTSPMLLARFNFPTNQQANANHIGQTVFAHNKVFALDANNGIVAFTILPPANLRASALLAAGQVLVSWPGNLTGWTLYSATTVGGPYATLVGSGTLSNGSYWVTNNPSATQKFYRLAR